MDKLPAVISVITRLEILGWYNIAPPQLVKLEWFIQSAFIHPLTEPVIQQTILLRQTQKIKLPDAIVACTALVENAALVTRNIDYFKKHSRFRLNKSMGHLKRYFPSLNIFSRPLLVLVTDSKTNSFVGDHTNKGENY